MLKGSGVATRLPVHDLARARRFYAEKLGLEACEERPGGLRYRCGSGEFALFESDGSSPGTFTQIAWEVDDLEATVAMLRGRGVVFEEVDVPGLQTVDGVAEVEGNYPSKGGRGERAAWFRDSEGNLLGIGEPIRDANAALDLDEIARAIVDANRYLTLATADADGAPWASPVWYAHEGHHDFLWVSAPNARHSRNIAMRPQVGIVIFDSTVAPGRGQAVYMSAVAVELADPDLGWGLSIYNRGSEAQGLRPWSLDDVRPPARHRLYAASASEHFVLSPRDERLPVHPG